MNFTAAQVKAIKADLNKKIIPWRGALYHGSPLSGMACILNDGFSATAEMQSMGGDLFSTSKNPRMLEMFSDNSGANGFRFMADFSKVLVLNDFWYALFDAISGSGSSFWEDLIEEKPSMEQKAIKFGIDPDQYSIDIADFLDEFVQKDVEAIMIPGFNDTHPNAEQEMAITQFGVKKLKGMLSAVIIDYQEYSWNEAKEVLADMGIEAEECY
jgi:hypothetical protein